MSNTGEFLVRAVACIKVADDRAAPERTISLQDDQAPVIDLLDNGLMVVYLVDEGDRFVWVQHRHCRAIGADPRGLMEFGLVNLRRLADKHLRLVEHGSIFGFLLDGQFEASLMLLEEIWDASLNDRTPNGAVVAIPSRSVLAFCDAANTEGIRQLRELVDRVTAVDDHKLTAQLFHRHEGAWRPYNP